MLWRVSRPIRSRSKPPGFILPCQPALAEKPPSGPGWLHEIKFDGYRVIARKDGEQVRLWARTTSDYSSATASPHQGRRCRVAGRNRGDRHRKVSNTSKECAQSSGNAA